MKSDLSLMIDDIRLNIRVGVIFKYQNKTLIEIRKDRVGNSVIPGGRVKIDELSIDALIREIKEEMHFTLKKDKLVFLKKLEYFFNFDNMRFHEFFFVYSYQVDEDDYQELIKVHENQDNHITEYLFVREDEFKKYDLLPLEVIDLIKNVSKWRNYE